MYAWDQPIIETNHGIASGALTGINFAMSTLNTLQLAKGDYKVAIPAIGMITGAGQLIYGLSGFSDEFLYNESMKRLAMCNIGVGTATLILSTCNLMDNKKYETKNTSWNIFSYPQQNAKSGMALSIAHAF